MGFGGVFAVLALLAYFFLVIDGRELRGVLAKGGWAVSVLYVVLAIVIVAVLTSHPDVATMSHGGMHHG